MRLFHIEARFDKTDKSPTYQEFVTSFENIIKEKGFSLVHYMVSLETALISKKKHYHMYFKIVQNVLLNSSKIICYESLHRLLKRRTKKTYGFASHQYHYGKIRNLSKYCVYMLKDLDLKKSTLPDSVLQEYIKETERVNQEKKRKMKHLLFEEALTYVENWTNGFSKMDIYIFIDEFHVDRDYLPPSFSLRTQYARYIVLKYPFVNDVIKNETYKLWI